MWGWAVTDRTCETCRFWEGKAAPGQCRRQPPTVVVKRWDEIDGDEVLRVCEVVSHCPKVGPSFWCGEWEGDPDFEVKT